MRFSLYATPLIAILIACGGGDATAETESQAAGTEGTTGGDVAQSDTTTTEASAEGEGESESESAEAETPAEEQPIDHAHANLRLLQSVADGDTPYAELVDRDEKGLLVVENHDGPDGLVQNATHFCHHPLETRYEHLTERLREDLERGRELDDMACNAVLNGPPRTDCSMGGTEEIPTTHYIFEETDDGLRLEAIYRISEIGKDERYVSRAFRFAERQTAQTRRRGCR